MLDINTHILLSKTVVTIIILLIDLVLSMIAKKIIHAFFGELKSRLVSERTISRTRTIRNLLKNVVDFVLFLITILIILSYWGINILPIITGAGILGLAFSFGAQTFIKDLISGMFIILEDQFHIGDIIKVGDSEGEVVNISLRLTVLKDKKGNYIYIPNSSIATLTRLKTTEKQK